MGCNDLPTKRPATPAQPFTPIFLIWNCTHLDMGPLPRETYPALSERNPLEYYFDVQQEILIPALPPSLLFRVPPRRAVPLRPDWPSPLHCRYRQHQLPPPRRWQPSQRFPPRLSQKRQHPRQGISRRRGHVARTPRGPRGRAPTPAGNRPLPATPRRPPLSLFGSQTERTRSSTSPRESRQLCSAFPCLDRQALSLPEPEPSIASS